MKLIKIYLFYFYLGKDFHLVYRIECKGKLNSQKGLIITVPPILISATLPKVLPTPIHTYTSNPAFEQAANFYNQSWNMLMTAIGIFIGVLSLFGIVIPLIINFLQNRRLKFEEQRIKDELKNYVNDLVRKTEKEIEIIKNTVNEESDKLQDQILDSISIGYTGMAGTALKDKNYIAALTPCLSLLEVQIQKKVSQENLAPILQLVFECLENMKNQKIDYHLRELFYNTVEKLEKYPEHKEVLNKIKTEFEEVASSLERDKGKP